MIIEITAVRETKRGRMALFTGEGFLFSVDDETYSRFGVDIGRRLDEEELALLRAESDTRKAKDQALRFLSRRAHSERELHDKLGRSFDEETVAAALQWLQQLDMIDDAAYALAKAEWLSGQGKSRNDIIRRLTAAGVDRDTAADAADAVGGDDEEQALGIVHKHYADKLRRGEEEKVKAALARRGFAHGDIMRAIGRAKEEMAE